MTMRERSTTWILSGRPLETKPVISFRESNETILYGLRSLSTLATDTGKARCTIAMPIFLTALMQTQYAISRILAFFRPPPLAGISHHGE
jgi:hypothetical protein